MAKGTSIAVLLRGSAPSTNDCSLTEILDLFEIPWTALTVDEARGDKVAALAAGRQQFSILTSAACLAEVLQRSETEAPPTWLARATSVFVYGFQVTDPCKSILRQITGDPEAEIRGPGQSPTTVSVTDSFPEMCGPMSGLQIQLERAANTALVVRNSNLQSIVGMREGHLFAEFTYSGVRFFADSSLAIVDIRERTATYFDVKKCFAGAVPIVMYLKWAFRDVCLTSVETSACLIIDDPPLWPRYGLLDFDDLLRLADKLTFATTIAFIPWNWRRTNRDTVAAFRGSGGKLSICVHGCDHTRGEFAARSLELLDRKLRTARIRMQALRKNTALNHENVMVFPQGAFSPEAASALKRNGFTAAVNTEVAPTDGALNETTLADLWSVAIVRYASFPIFTRRYIHHGIENFAFDGLLGKPCFIAGHHDLLRGRGSELATFLRLLASLQWKLCWRPLEDAVRRSYGVRSNGETILVKMLAERLLFENVGATTRRICVMKREPQVASLEGVEVNQDLIAYEYIDGHVRVIVDVPPGGSADIRFIYREQLHGSPASESIRYRFGVAVRRYLSELRDNCGHRLRSRA
ncbi:hypothetical protein [Bradyrhizobium sp. CCBAU 53421]|uniref:hypothetical protein n=1 Tax=Bradyrhizobium sp. CCBAU 53421 TaxID=1325120 RepID=UPI00188CB8A3|nr:hypothetical protein [Bradyrhizobium sp. CCBAU 53421]QOZ35137.1 hypothetical protein XH92_28555 [Bradyrhizobium sp. CCBAU 53421]